MMMMMMMSDDEYEYDDDEHDDYGNDDVTGSAIHPISIALSSATKHNMKTSEKPVHT
jgi:hypothetical protein